MRGTNEDRLLLVPRPGLTLIELKAMPSPHWIRRRKVSITIVPRATWGPRLSVMPLCHEWEAHSNRPSRAHFLPPRLIHVSRSSIMKSAFVPLPQSIELFSPNLNLLAFLEDEKANKVINCGWHLSSRTSKPTNTTASGEFHRRRDLVALCDSAKKQDFLNWAELSRSAGWQFWYHPL